MPRKKKTKEKVMSEHQVAMLKQYIGLTRSTHGFMKKNRKEIDRLSSEIDTYVVAQEEVLVMIESILNSK